jgi:serine protease AprX
MNGLIVQGSGTSFASPMMAGATAALWQAYPTLSAKELMRWIIESGDRYLDPDVNYGYGIPNFRKAYHTITSMELNTYSNEIKVYPNPFTSFINIDLLSLDNIFKITIYDIQGRMVFSSEAKLPGRIDLPEILHPGIYLLELSNSEKKYRSRLIKY